MAKYVLDFKELNNGTFSLLDIKFDKDEMLHNYNPEVKRKAKERIAAWLNTTTQTAQIKCQVPKDLEWIYAKMPNYWYTKCRNYMKGKETSSYLIDDDKINLIFCDEEGYDITEMLQFIGKVETYYNQYIVPNFKNVLSGYIKNTGEG